MYHLLQTVLQRSCSPLFGQAMIQVWSRLEMSKAFIALTMKSYEISFDEFMLVTIENSYSENETNYFFRNKIYLRKQNFYLKKTNYYLEYDVVSRKLLSSYASDKQSRYSENLRCRSNSTIELDNNSIIF